MREGTNQIVASSLELPERCEWLRPTKLVEQPSGYDVWYSLHTRMLVAREWLFLGPKPSQWRSRPLQQRRGGEHCGSLWVYYVGVALEEQA